MKTLVRLMSVCSLVMVGVVATPSLASADEPVQSEEVVGTTSQAIHGSHMKMFKRALEAADLRPEQQAEVDKMISAAKERHAPVKKARADFMVALADQIESGKIDTCKIAPQTKALAEAKAKTRPGDRADFEKLHALLDPEQRTHFVDSLRSQGEAAKRAHNTQAIVDKMSRELKLTDDQKEKVSEIISGLKQIRDAEPGHAEHRARWQRILDGFKSDHFVLDEIAPMGDDVEAKATKRIEAHLWAGQALLPILNDEQRATVATKLRDKAKGHDGTEKTTEPKDTDKGAQYQQPAQDQQQAQADSEDEDEGEED